MKSAHRYTALFLVLLLLLSVLTGCGAKTVDGVTVPSGMRLIVSEADDYNLIVPDTWLTETTVGMTSAYAEDAAHSSVSVLANEVTGLSGTTLNEYYDNAVAQLGAAFPDFALTYAEPSDVKVGFAADPDNYIDGMKYTYSATVGGVQYQWMQVLFIRNATIYIMTYTSTAEAYDDHLEDVSNIIAYFSFR